MIKKKNQIALWVIVLTICFSTVAYAAPEQHVSDAPVNSPAGIVFRPLYMQQLGGLSDRLQNSPAFKPDQYQHTVVRGETLNVIAEKYGTSVEYLLRVNNIRNPNFIRAGQVLTLLTDVRENAVAKVAHTLQRGETVWDLSRRYGISMDAILVANNITDPNRLALGQKLVIPGVTVSPLPAQPSREVVVASRSVPRSADFIWPSTGYISSGYGPRWGRFHYAIDIADVTGTPIVAIASGIVTEVGWRHSYGYMVRIDHRNGWESVYGHASRLHVKSGNTVMAGQQIADIGETGNATGPHVHLEMIFQGKFQNPLKHLPAR